MILLVTYDLKGHAGSYEALFKAIQMHGPWWHYIPSTWLVSTTKSPKEIFATIQPNLKVGDNLLITELGQYWGVLPKDAWDWITAQGGGLYKTSS